MKVWLWSNPKLNKKGKTQPVEYEINPGVTMLIGSNGTGKTTVLTQLHSIFYKGGDYHTKFTSIKHNKDIAPLYDSYLFNKLDEEKYTKQHWLEIGQTQKLAQAFENSEGQNIYNFLVNKVEQIGAVVKKARQDGRQGVFILLDGLDSGLSLNILYELKHNLLDFIINTEKRHKNFEVYIICSSNSYELCNGYDCIDVTNQTHHTFQNYSVYFNYFMCNVKKVPNKN